MEAKRPSEAVVHNYLPTRRHIPEESNLQSRRWGEIRNRPKYEVHLESKERFAIQRYLLIIEKKQNMQVLSHTFTYFST